MVFSRLLSWVLYKYSRIKFSSIGISFSKQSVQIEDAIFQFSAQISSCLKITQGAAQKVQVTCKDCKCLLLEVQCLSVTLEVSDVSLTELLVSTGPEDKLKTIVDHITGVLRRFFRRVFNTTAMEIRDLSVKLRGSVDIDVTVSSGSVCLNPSGRVSIATLREVKVDMIKSSAPDARIEIQNVFLSMQPRTKLLRMDGMRVDFQKNAVDVPSIFFLLTPFTLVCNIPAIDVAVSNPVEFLNKVLAVFSQTQRVPMSCRKSMALSVATVSLDFGSAGIDFDGLHILVNKTKIGAYIHGAKFGSNSLEGFLLFNASTKVPFRPIFCVRDLYISRQEKRKDVTQAERAMEQLFQLFSLPWLDKMAEYKVLNLHFID